MAPKLKWTKTYAGRYTAEGLDHFYLAQRVPHGGRERWQLQIESKSDIHAESTDWHDSFELARETAEAFEVEPESEHFAQLGRFARAVIKAYSLRRD